LKDYLGRRLLIIAFATFFLLLLSRLNLGTIEKSVSQNQIVNTTISGSPVRLTIPAINVNVVVEHVGVNTSGEMDVPSNTVDVAWFKLGPRPGEKGSSVISGHFDGKNGTAGVFNNLHKLEKGDKLYIEYDKGTFTTFVVRESRIYDPGYAEEVFSSSDGVHLNLITCDGVWDKNKKKLY